MRKILDNNAAVDLGRASFAAEPITSATPASEIRSPLADAALKFDRSVRLETAPSAVVSAQVREENLISKVTSWFKDAAQNVGAALAFAFSPVRLSKNVGFASALVGVGAVVGVAKEAEAGDVKDGGVNQNVAVKQPEYKLKNVSVQPLARTESLKLSIPLTGKIETEAGSSISVNLPPGWSVYAKQLPKFEGFMVGKRTSVSQNMFDSWAEFAFIKLDEGVKFDAWFNDYVGQVNGSDVVKPGTITESLTARDESFHSYPALKKSEDIGGLVARVMRYQAKTSGMPLATQTELLIYLGDGRVLRITICDYKGSGWQDILNGLKKIDGRQGKSAENPLSFAIYDEENKSMVTLGGRIAKSEDWVSSIGSPLQLPEGVLDNWVIYRKDPKNKNESREFGKVLLTRHAILGEPDLKAFLDAKISSVISEGACQSFGVPTQGAFKHVSGLLVDYTCAKPSSDGERTQHFLAAFQGPGLRGNGFAPQRFYLEVALDTSDPALISEYRKKITDFCTSLYIFVSDGGEEVAGKSAGKDAARSK